MYLRSGKYMSVASRLALRVSLLYVIAAVLWMVLSDIVLSASLAEDLVLRIQTIKGSIFVAVTGLLLFGLIRRSSQREMASREAHRESEQRWRELVDRSPAAIVLLDGRRTVYGNRAAADLMGAKDARALRGKSIDVVLPNGAGMDEHQTSADVEEGSQLFARQYTIQRPDGTSRTVEDHSTNVQLGGRNVTLSILLDITDRVEYERMLIRAKEEAESLVVMKESILTNLSHEIRTPLTGMLGIAEALTDEVEGEAHDLATLLQASGWRLSRTIDSILTLAQLESDTTTFAREPVDVVAASARIVAVYAPQASAKNITLELDAPNRAILILTEPLALDQILMNLISNATKFTHFGGVSVKIRADDESAYLEVKDTGVGISESFLPQIFDDYRQESQGVSRDFEGSGLGMAIVKRLLDKLGGDIEIESTKGVGTSVKTILPLAAKTRTHGPRRKSQHA